MFGCKHHVVEYTLTMNILGRLTKSCSTAFVDEHPHLHLVSNRIVDLLPPQAHLLPCLSASSTAVSSALTAAFLTTFLSRSLRLPLLRPLLLTLPLRVNLNLLSLCLWLLLSLELAACMMYC